MVSVKTVLDLVNFISNKETAGNTMSPDEFNTVIEAANLDILVQEYGLPEEYKAGQPLPRMSYEITKKIMDDLKHLKVRMGVDTAPLLTDEFGRADIPSNYLHLSSARFNDYTNNECITKTVKSRDIELLTDAQIANRLCNSITMPTKKDPCMAIFSTYFQFYPANLKRIELTYLRLPVKPYYNYTIDENDEVIFNPIGSVDFEYPADMLPKIVRVVASYVNINLKESNVVSYLEQAKIEGV